MLVILSWQISLAQHQNDLLILRSGDSVQCEIISFDADWVTIKYDVNERTRRKTYPNARITALVENYGQESERVVLGENAYWRNSAQKTQEPVKPEKPTQPQPIASSPAPPSPQAPDAASAMNMAASHLMEAGNLGITAIIISLAATTGGVLIASVGGAPVGFAVITVGTVVSLVLEVMSRGSLKKSARNLKRAADQLDG